MQEAHDDRPRTPHRRSPRARALFVALATVTLVGCGVDSDPLDRGAPDVVGEQGLPATVTAIPPYTSLYWLLENQLDETRPETVFDIDIFDAAPAGSYLDEPDGTRINLPAGPNAGAVTRLKAAGKTVICYFDTGAWESYRPDAAKFPKAVIGNSTGWSGEKWLDIRKASWSKFEGIILARMDLAVRMGCDGVEGDQNNPLGNNPGFAITLADEAAWYLEMAQQLHARGLRAVMKNGIEVLDHPTYGPQAVAAHEAALNEECHQYDECYVHDPFVAAGKVVWNVEYVTSPATFCPLDNASNFDGYFSHDPPDGTIWTACR
ncbi:endo alpha-1,4 polygalactosaminidase [Polyangium aurulentum]|uniref:endo alpha-1,4 polygalactosaminidase n=1 Tax=Polyangium aurulentum TaxID=2567896 RepID=UPI0010AE0397|nr:endo alpha-1,4 polygalactosaminidase [Polyangium aurulentum]UQA60542.1 endo alpha-1,4 polygalactosaminidase [Polyangium aurulentum]